MSGTILLVTQDREIQNLLFRTLTHRGYRVLIAETATSAMEQIQRHPIITTITEIGPRGISNHDCANRIVRELLRMSALVIAAEETPVKVLSEVIEHGASQLIIKPFAEHELIRCLDRALSERLPPSSPPLSWRQSPSMPTIITQNPAFQSILTMAAKAARTDTTILITGETGTGKELLAQEIHRLSRRASRPFVVVNCAALSETLLESELFGHARGAFTGADQAKPGFFEIANGGTIFLDEIGDVSPTFQLKLLRVLQQGEYNRVGDTRVYHTDVRVLAATNQNLSDAVRAGRFRADLYYRLNVVHLHLPPLRERKDDIPALVHFFLQKCSQRLNRPAPRLSPEALQLLERHDWPGNVRELQNAIERAVIMCDDGEVCPEHLPDELHPSRQLMREAFPSTPDFNAPFKVAKERFLGDFERQYILHHLSLHRGNVAQTARATGMFEGHLYQKMKRYHINPDQFRPRRASAHRAAKLA